MQVEEYFTFAAIMSATSALLGWWLKSRLDSSIRHEYDRFLELFKAEQKREEVLQVERLKAFRDLSSNLSVLRRYCAAREAEVAPASEFCARTDDLSHEERLSLLQHSDSLSRVLDEYELFLSPASRVAFDQLFQQLSMGCGLELLLAGGSDLALNSESLYREVVERINDVRTSLYSDLGLPQDVKKTDKTPPKELALARKRMKEWKNADTQTTSHQGAC